MATSPSPTVQSGQIKLMLRHSEKHQKKIYAKVTNGCGTRAELRKRVAPREHGNHLLWRVMRLFIGALEQRRSVQRCRNHGPPGLDSHSAVDNTMVFQLLESNSAREIRAEQS